MTTDTVHDAVGTHHLASTPDTVFWGELPGAHDRPSLAVRPGDTVTVDTVSHEGILPDQGRNPREFFSSFGVPADRVQQDAIGIAADREPAAGPHVVTGPIAVRGARPGDLLSVTILDVRRRTDYGIVSSRHSKGALPGELPETPVHSTFCRAVGDEGFMPLRQDEAAYRGETPGIRFPLRPFLGIIGVARAEHGRPNSVPPGAHGGNLDISSLQAGATLHLPVQVPDALLYVGDPHFSQGDGEVALTAFEAPLRATVKVDIVPGAGRFAGGRPFAETDELLIAIGLDADLDEACRDSVRAALTLLTQRYRIPRALAYAYLSAAGDVRISQVVDQVKGCHTVIRKSDFREFPVKDRS